MGISLSGGDYQYNRFDAYEASLEEGKGSSDPEKMKKKVDKAAKKSRKTGRDLRDEDEKEEEKEEESTADGGNGDGGGGMSEGYGDAKGARNEQGGMRRLARIAQDNKKPTDKHAAAQAAGEARQKERDANIAKGLKPDGSPKINKEEVESFFIEDEEGNIYEGK